MSYAHNLLFAYNMIFYQLCKTIDIAQLILLMTLYYKSSKYPITNSN
jgi:hypothetical protein